MDIVFYSCTEAVEVRAKFVVEGVIAEVAAHGIVPLSVLLPVRVSGANVSGVTVIDWRKKSLKVRNELLFSDDAIPVLVGYLESRKWDFSP